MNIYDSLYTSFDEITKVIVSSLFRTRINMHMEPLQKQVGGTDCGLFAIAWLLLLPMVKTHPSLS